MTAQPFDAAPATAPGDRLLPWREVKGLAGLSRTTAWRLQNAGDFPRPVAISPGRVAWRESDVTAWRIRLAPRDVGSLTRVSRPPPVASPAPSVPTSGVLAPHPPVGAPPAPTVGPAPPRGRRRTAVADAQMSFDF